MNDIHMLNAMQEMLYYVMIAVCVITVPVLVVGLVLSVVQAATQINEPTMTFIPKFIVMFTLLFLLSPWLMSRLIYITHTYMNNLPSYIR
ncbi:MAG: flagellar biosynthetic protein FliQ [Gammaproteobacteria bacterium]